MKKSNNSRDNNPKISPRCYANDWRDLNLSKKDSPDWNKAVSIFKDRMKGRFLEPVESIINQKNHNIREFSGFTIMAIDCLIIETLNQFYKGIDETEGKHWKAFRDVFKGSPFFRDEFQTNKKCEIFYGHFRCGLLHQAQTKGKSRIRYGEPKMVQLINPKDINEGLIVDRKKFHKALINEIDSYIEKLKNPRDKRDLALRGKFKRKMNFIVG